MTAILAADIGGTNSRFSAFSVDKDGLLQLDQLLWLKTAEADSFNDLLGQLKEAGFMLHPANADIAVFAVAGPIEEGRRCVAPNIKWAVDLDKIEPEYSNQKTILINDFCAQAGYCLSPKANSLREIKFGRPTPGAPVAIVGAGTGFGQCLLVPPAEMNKRHIVLPSEGGHTMFPLQGELESQYASFLLGQSGKKRIDLDMVVSGSGLRALHLFLTGEQKRAKEISDGLLQPTMDLFSTLYARACRTYILHTMALGGLIISGGMAGHCPQIVESKKFLEEFITASPPFDALLDNIPIHLNTDHNAGLWGAAALGMELLYREA